MEGSEQQRGQDDRADIAAEDALCIFVDGAAENEFLDETDGDDTEYKFVDKLPQMGVLLVAADIISEAREVWYYGKYE